MMAPEHAPQEQTLEHRDALTLNLNSGNITLPALYEGVHVDEAYPLTQRQIVEYENYRADAFSRKDGERMAGSIALQNSVILSIERQMEQGFLIDPEEGALAPEEVPVAAKSYFHESLERYRKAGLDPRLARVKFDGDMRVDTSESKAVAQHSRRLFRKKNIPASVEDEAAEKAETKLQRLMRVAGELGRTASERFVELISSKAVTEPDTTGMIHEPAPRRK